MGDIVQKVTTDVTFHEGRLVPPGTVITLDTSKGDFNFAPPKFDGSGGNTPNLADPGNALVNVAVPVAPIAPTGPNPTMPQQVPPGAMQTTAGYAIPGGALLVAEGSQAAADAGSIEEEGPVRRQPSEATGDAMQAAITPQPANPPLGSETVTADERRELEELRRFRSQAVAQGASTLGTGGPAHVENGENSGQTNPPPAGFDPEAVIDGTVPEVTKRLDGLTREQLVAVKDAEQDRELPRVGVAAAVDARLADLDEFEDL